MTEPSSIETHHDSTGLAPGVGSAHRDVSVAKASESAAPASVDGVKNAVFHEGLPLNFKALDGRIVQTYFSIDESIRDVMTRVAAELGKSVDSLRFLSKGRRIPITDMVREHWEEWGRSAVVHVVPAGRNSDRPTVVVSGVVQVSSYLTCWVVLRSKFAHCGYAMYSRSLQGLRLSQS